MIIPHQILDWVNELNNTRSNETTRLNYLTKLEDVHTYITQEIDASGYGINAKSKVTKRRTNKSYHRQY